MRPRHNTPKVKGFFLVHLGFVLSVFAVFGYLMFGVFGGQWLALGIVATLMALITAGVYWVDKLK